MIEIVWGEIRLFGSFSAQNISIFSSKQKRLNMDPRITQLAEMLVRDAIALKKDETILS